MTTLETQKDFAKALNIKPNDFEWWFAVHVNHTLMRVKFGPFSFILQVFVNISYNQIAIYVGLDEANMKRVFDHLEKPYKA